MKVIEFKNNELYISDEAYHIRCFRELHDRDSEAALNIFGFLYFFYNPASDYNYITDSEEKQEVILEALGLDDSFLKDELYLQCCSVYEKMVVTTSSKLIDNNRKRLQKLDTFLDELELTQDNVGKFTKAISDGTKLAVEISNAEKEIAKDIEEQSVKARGKTELTIGDRGLENL